MNFTVLIEGESGPEPHLNFIDVSCEAAALPRRTGVEEEVEEGSGDCRSVYNRSPPRVRAFRSEVNIGLRPPGKDRDQGQSENSPRLVSLSPTLSAPFLPENLRDESHPRQGRVGSASVERDPRLHPRSDLSLTIL